MGYWDGNQSGYWKGTEPFAPSTNKVEELRRLDSLQPDARIAVLTHEAMSLFDVMPKNGNVLLKAGGKTVLTLTSPTLADLELQLPILRMASDLRGDRMAEILAQQGDMLSFFGAQQPLNWNRKRWTMIFLHAVYNAVSSQEMRIKHFCSVPRPNALSPQVQPVIATPGHSAYPSGHATEAFAFAAVLACLRMAVENPGTSPVAAVRDALGVMPAPGAPEAAGAPDALTLLFRLAARIADNRTVAGVHYPVDSAHGALLGVASAMALVAHAEGVATPLPVLAARGSDWVIPAAGGQPATAKDFTLRDWRVALATAPGAADAWQTGDSYAMAKPAAWHSLPAVWKAAVAEW